MSNLNVNTVKGTAAWLALTPAEKSKCTRHQNKAAKAAKAGAEVVTTDEVISTVGVEDKANSFAISGVYDGMGSRQGTTVEVAPGRYTRLVIKPSKFGEQYTRVRYMHAISGSVIHVKIWDADKYTIRGKSITEFVQSDELSADTKVAYADVIEVLSCDRYSKEKVYPNSLRKGYTEYISVIKELRAAAETVAAEKAAKEGTDIEAAKKAAEFVVPESVTKALKDSDPIDKDRYLRVVDLANPMLVLSQD